MLDLMNIMRRLRAKDGCPWDQEQTHESLRPYMLEEAAEAVDAISKGDLQELKGELGDVLLQIAFHSVIAEESGTFSYAEVEQGICDKLIRRHPHVFGDTTVENAEEVTRNWQTIKTAENGGKEKHPLERIPSSLGALERSRQTMKALQEAKGTKDGVQQALQSAPESEEGVVQVLEAVIAWARSLDVNPEIALRARTEQRIAHALNPAE
ncbi:MazG family protein [Deinococcus cellulosilyticus]|uniref:Nucleoside triphosphate pyrophosphohydrolase n=1 Tax=Deinococcus cellulosilyticus (strain DSM 18568 / NBRC 106333 / KACC 11606 / 5516J-15) TaxID=1223518 RepID=A0A511N009_DEIC1|nr:MazG family protein [Deinococcus cellulosilyticus]GEM46153.1 nucleoside triphosphate pyrophosphohydrolase [Deinococcus cellulosilyticus NBRC 106333 = KACC 11606]